MIGSQNLSIRVKLLAAIVVANSPITGHFVSMSSGGIVSGVTGIHTATNGIAAVTVCPITFDSNINVLKNLQVTNTDTAEITVILEQWDLTTARTIASAILPVGSTLTIDSDGDIAVFPPASTGGTVTASAVKTYANLAAFPAVGDVNYIYIASDTNKLYRWGGSIYVEVSASVDFTPVGSVHPFAAAVSAGYLNCDGTASGNRTTHAALFKYLVTDVGFTSHVFTVTIANPAVFTMTAHGFSTQGGERIRLSTTGALPTGLAVGIDYFVIYVDANTFRLSLTFGGAAIVTSGTQSGTHSYMQSLYGLGDGTTTFNVPDYRGQGHRGLDAGAGIDTGRGLGTKQADMFKSHTHVLSPQTPGGSVTAWSYTIAATGSGTADISGATGGTETRAKNVAVNYGIKY